MRPASASSAATTTTTIVDHDRDHDRDGDRDRDGDHDRDGDRTGAGGSNRDRDGGAPATAAHRRWRPRRQPAPAAARTGRGGGPRSLVTAATENAGEQQPSTSARRAEPGAAAREALEQAGVTWLAKVLGTSLEPHELAGGSPDTNGQVRRHVSLMPVASPGGKLLCPM